MKKILTIQNLKCSSCAQKIQKAVAQLVGVNEVKVDFAASQISLDVDQTKYAGILPTIKAITERVDPNATLTEN